MPQTHGQRYSSQQSAGKATFVPATGCGNPSAMIPVAVQKALNEREAHCRRLLSRHKVRRSELEYIDLIMEIYNESNSDKQYNNNQVQDMW